MGTAILASAGNVSSGDYRARSFFDWWISWATRLPFAASPHFSAGILLLAALRRFLGICPLVRHFHLTSDHPQSMASLCRKSPLFLCSPRPLFFPGLRLACQQQRQSFLFVPSHRLDFRPPWFAWSDSRLAARVEILQLCPRNVCVTPSCCNIRPAAVFTFIFFYRRSTRRRRYDVVKHSAILSSILRLILESAAEGIYCASISRVFAPSLILPPFAFLDTLLLFRYSAATFTLFVTTPGRMVSLALLPSA